MMDKIQFRRSSPEDAERLTALGLASKAYWGYDQELLKLWKPMLQVTEEDIAIHTIWSMLEENEVIGFFSLDRNKNVLSDFFLAPEYIGKGIGKLMFQKFMEVMNHEGIESVTIVSDPNAQAFYEKMGSVKIGEQESTPKGRYLPILKYKQNTTEPGASHNERKRSS